MNEKGGKTKKGKKKEVGIKEQAFQWSQRLGGVKGSLSKMKELIKRVGPVHKDPKRHQGDQLTKMQKQGIYLLCAQ